VKHPYAETADLLRALARIERRDKWADPARIRRLQSEAAELDRLAKTDNFQRRLPQ
jgi:hypothetical protein